MSMIQKAYLALFLGCLAGCFVGYAFFIAGAS